MTISKGENRELKLGSRRWHTQRCVENSITNNSIGLPLHTDERDTDKVGSSYSSWRDILSGVPQGSILGLLLINRFINDLFHPLAHTNITNFADVKTPYNIENVSLFPWILLYNTVFIPGFIFNCQAWSHTTKQILTHWNDNSWNF